MIYEVDVERLHQIKGKQCPCLPPGTPDEEEKRCPCDGFTLTGVCRCALFKKVMVEE